MDNSFLDQFPLPQEAAVDLQRKGISEQRLQDGVSLMTSGHHGGLSYRFFVHQTRNEVLSEKTDFPVFESEDMIEWYRDRKNKITEKVRFLPKELLKFDKYDGTCIGGLYKDAYDRFKAGLSVAGLALRTWNKIPEGAVLALEELGIFTVEQFAAQPRQKIETRFPKELQEAFQLAIEYVNGKDTREQAQQTAQQLMAVMNENAKLNKEMEDLREQMAALISGQEAPARKSKKKEDA